MTAPGHKLLALALAVAVVMAVLSGGTTVGVLNDAESVSVEFSVGNIGLGNDPGGGNDPDGGNSPDVGNSPDGGNSPGHASMAPALFASPGTFEMWAGVRTVRRRENRKRDE